MLRDNPEVQRAHRRRITALGRIAVADDIGPAIAALLRPGNHWVTGQRIEVSAACTSDRRSRAESSHPNRTTR